MLSTAFVDGVFDGELSLKMDEEILSLEGEVESVRGELKAMGATFTMSEASLSFLGRDYYNPIMDIEATRTIDSYDVVTSLTGTVATPQIAFSSTSSTPLSQTDLISLILFGRVSSDLGDNNPLLSSVMTSLSGSMTQLLGASLVDRFSWDPASQQIEVGVSLSEKLYLSLTQVYQGQSQDIQSQTVIGLEWFIMKSMYMEMLSNLKTGSISGYVFHKWRY
jgi:autotransporter translocation and assembly factor TamB